MSLTRGEWLRQQRLARGWDIPRMASELRDAARRVSDTLPGPESLQQMIRRWESGRRGTGVSERYRLHYCQALGIAPGRFGMTDPAASPGAPGEAGGVLPTGREHLQVTMAAESQAFGEWAGTSQTADSAIEFYAAQARRLARDFEYAPPVPLLAEIRQLRDSVTAQLHGHQRPDQARELYLIAAQVFGCLAWMTGDMGNYRAADTHAWTAWVCAGQAGHDGARAWVRVTQSKLAYWDGRYAEAAQLAEDGLGYRCGDSAHTFLSLFRARALARAGDQGRAARALQEAAGHRERVAAPDLLGGIWELTPARFHGLAAGTRLLLGEPTAALAEVSDAVSLSQAGSPGGRHLFAEMLFRVDGALAHLHQPDLDGAADALQPVLALTPDMRTEPVIQQLTVLRRRLARPVFTGSPQARHLGEELTAYTLDAAPGGVPSRRLPPAAP